jgi:predicted TIM-barrel fold metal-dependent hydrolase
MPAPVIIDAHRHLWDPVRQPYPWLSPDATGGPSASPYLPPYLPGDFAADTAGVTVAGSVLMEGGHADALAEARWLSELAAADGDRTAVVARVALADAGVGAQLDALARLPRVHGVRQILNVAAPGTPRPVYAAGRADLMTDPAWRRGLARVGAAGLSFDVQAQPDQLTQVAALAADFGAVSFVLNHGGYMTARTEAADQAWRAGLRALARQPNVVVKASDYSTVDPSLQGLDGFVRELIDVFGPGRVLFASNFPAERRALSYRGLVARFGAALSGLDPADQEAIWCGNASRVYRLGPPGTARPDGRN